MPGKLLRFPLVVVSSACLAFLVIVGFRWYLQRAAAATAVHELAACQRLVQQIKSYRASPQTALLEKQSQQQVLLAIQSAAQIAKIPDNDILRITPLQDRRRGKSDHVEQPTSVEIREVTMKKLARFLSELSLLDVGLQPTTIRLAAPRVAAKQAEQRDTGAERNEVTEVWSCNLVLTYLVFSPE